MDVSNMEVIATNQVHFPIMVLVYEVDDECIIAKVGSAYVDSQWAVDKQTARKYKLYYNTRRDSYYFIKDGRRFYLDETIRRF